SIDAIAFEEQSPQSALPSILGNRSRIERTHVRQSTAGLTPKELHAMNDVCVTTPDPLKTPLKPSRSDDRCQLATADHAEAGLCNDDRVLSDKDIIQPAAEARKASMRVPARVKCATDVRRALENRHRWLLFAQHCYTCSRTEEDCDLGKLCTYGKKTLKHVAQCKRDDCSYPRCTLLKPLLQHSRKCQSSSCAICVPVWNYIQKELQQQEEQQRERHQKDAQRTHQQRKPPRRPSPPPPQQPPPGSSAAVADDVSRTRWVPTHPPSSTGGPPGGSAVSDLAVEQCRSGDEPCGRSSGREPEDPQPGSSSAAGALVELPDWEGTGRLSCTSTPGVAGRGAGSHLGGALECGQQQGGTSDVKLAAGEKLRSLQQQQPPPAQQQIQREQQTVQAPGAVPDVRTEPLQSAHSQKPPSLHQAQQQMPQISQKQQELGQLQQSQQHQPIFTITTPMVQNGPAAAISAAAAPRFLGVAPGTLPPYTFASYSGGLVTPLGPNPVEVSEHRPKGITINAAPQQPIPVISCTAMHPPPPAGSSSQLPQVVHSYPPSASLGSFYSHLSQNHAKPPAGTTATVATTTHWLPLPGLTTVPRGASVTPAATPNGTNGVGAGNGGLFVTNAGAAASTATAAGPSTAALWPSQGTIPSNPVAVYGITADGVRTGGLGTVTTQGPVQAVDRFSGLPYTFAGVNGGLSAAAGAMAMAAPPLLLWPHHQPTAAMAAAAAAAAAAPAVVSGAQGHLTAHLPTTYAVASAGGARPSNGTTVLEVNGGAAATSPGTGTYSTQGSAVAPTHSVSAHRLLYGPAGIVQSAGGASAAASITGSSGGPAGASVNSTGAVADSATGAVLWNYLMQ
ncbi:hypothetical protein Vafri_3908, partial [Volvox africanus]